VMTPNKARPTVAHPRGETTKLVCSKVFLLVTIFSARLS
jgi:hypothetical protein